ncbi:MAG: hypothetical protein H6814_04565 [Phycisphaeraceae bacterium]|nr:hypothetical protein [Phycisphaeraceae bacterium]
MKRRKGTRSENPMDVGAGSKPRPSVDAYFDRELCPDTIESLLDSMRRSRTERQRFDDTQSMLDDLRAPIDAPDVSCRILGEVGERRGWLTTGQRRMVFVGRLATAACLLLVVSGLLLVRRNNPQAFRAADATGPVSGVVAATGSEAEAGIRAIGDQLRTFERICEPAVADAASSVTSCDSLCGKVRAVTVSAPQDFSMPLSPGLGEWLGAGNVKVVVVVSRTAPGDLAPAGADETINQWMIAPGQSFRLPSYDAPMATGPRQMNVADWTTSAGRIR